MKIWNEIEKIQDKDKRIKLHLEIFPNDKNIPAILAKQARRDIALHILMRKDIDRWERQELMDQWDLGL